MSSPSALRPIVGLILGGWIALQILPSSLDAEVKPTLPAAFLEKLEQAKTPAAQDAVIRSAEPAVTGAELRKQLLAHIYQITLGGEYVRAAQDCAIVLRLAREAGDGEDAAAAQINLGYILRESGDLAGALDAIDQALTFYTAHPEHVHGLISVHQARGITQLVQSDFARALESFQRALALSEKIKYREGIIPALNSIGEVYRGQGQPERALQYYERARQAVGDDNAWNMAFIFNNIGMSYDALGDFDRAIEFIQRARAVAEKVKFRPRVANSLAILGDLELKRGKPDKARALYEEELRLARELRDVAAEAQATLGLAQVAQAGGENAGAIEQAERAAELFRKLGQKVDLATALTLHGRSLRALQREEEAGAAFSEAIAAVEEVRGHVAGGDVERETFFAQQIAPYHEMISLLVRQNKPAQALAMAERASARVLLDITRGARTELTSALTPQEQQSERELEIKLASAERELARLRTAEKQDAGAIVQAEASLRETQRAREEFETLSATTHPELRRAALPAPLVATADLAPLLGGGKTGLLRYVVTDTESFLFLVTRPADSGGPQLKVVSLGKKRRDLARLAEDFRGRLAVRSLAWEKPARDLYGLLLQPVEKELAGLESIVIVPDGPLWELPFQALEKEADHPLLADYTIRYAPSLTLLSRLAQGAAPAPPEHTLLAFVNPALSRENKEAATEKIALMNSDWQPLPETELQAPELKNIYPPPAGQVFVGAEAREKVFKKEAPQAGLLHFAMHGVLDDRAPLYSYLLFSQVNVAPEEDGRLETRELMKMKLCARLAVLCGCETARGQVTAGEGVIGLSWGFFVAGCPATIVSQWKVDSASSTPLMIELHRRLHDGAGNAEALRTASLELRKDARYRHPFYWAPFVLVGR